MLYHDSVGANGRILRGFTCNLWHAIELCALHLVFKIRVVVAIDAAIALGRDDNCVSFGHGQRTRFVADVVVLCLCTAYGYRIVAGSGCFGRCGREDRLLRQHVLSIVVLEALINSLERWHRVALLLRVVAGGDSQRSLGDGQRAIGKGYVIVLHRALFHHNGISANGRALCSLTSYLRHTIELCALYIIFKRRVVFAINAAVALGRDDYRISLGHGQRTGLVTDVVVLRLCTAHGYRIAAGNGCFGGRGRNNRLLRQHVLGLIVLEAIINSLERWHRVALLLRVVAGGDSQRSLGDGQRAIGKGHVIILHCALLDHNGISADG